MMCYVALLRYLTCELIMKTFMLERYKCIRGLVQVL